MWISSAWKQENVLWNWVPVTSQGAQMVTTWVAVQMKKPLKLSLHGAFGTSIVIMNDNEKTKKRYE